MDQLSFFDLNDRLAQISKIGDPLEVLNEIVDWSKFDSVLLEARNALRDFLSSPMYICLSRAICGAISSIATNINSSDDKLCHFKLVNNHLREQSHII